MHGTEQHVEVQHPTTHEVPLSQLSMRARLVDPLLAAWYPHPPTRSAVYSVPPCTPLPCTLSVCPAFPYVPGPLLKYITSMNICFRATHITTVLLTVEMYALEEEETKDGPRGGGGVVVGIKPPPNGG